MIQKCLLVLMIIDAIAGPFYNIIKVMMKGPNKRSNLKKIAVVETGIEQVLFFRVNIKLSRYS